MTKKLPIDVKQSRKPTRVACSFCHSKHLQCDTTRPCKNCIKRGHADSCTDAIRRKKGIPKSRLPSDAAPTAAGQDGTSRLKPELSPSPATASTTAGNTPVDLLLKHSNGSIAAGPDGKTGATVSGKANPEILSTAKHSTAEKAQAVKVPKKRGRPPKNKTNDLLTPKTKQGKTKGKKSQKLNNGEPKETIAAEERAPEELGKDEAGGKEEKEIGGGERGGNNAQFPSLQKQNLNSQQYTNATNHERPSFIESNLQSTNDLAGLGVVTPASSSNLLPPPISLLNLANVSLSSMNLQQMNPSSSGTVSQNMKTDPSLSDLRLPSFSDLKAPLFPSMMGEVRTPQFDLKVPVQSFSPDLKNHSGSNQTLSMMGLPSLSSAGMQALLQNHSADTGFLKKAQDKDDTLPRPSQSSESANIDPRNVPLNLGVDIMSANNREMHSHLNSNQPSKTADINSRGNASNQASASARDHGILGMIQDPAHTVDPETPGSPLEFSVSSTTRANTMDMNAPTHESLPLSSNHSLNQSLDSRFATQDVLSSNSSIRNFESTMANEEYTQLTDLLNTNPPTPTGGFPEGKKKRMEMHDNIGSKLKTLRSSRLPSPELENEEAFVKGISPTDSDDDDDTRPFIVINLEDLTMISSYPNNTTPNSFVYNADHSQMPNTAKEVPHDIEQAENYTSPLIMRHVIKQPDDIYLTSIVKAYQYPKAYHALIAYLKKRFNKRQLLEIAKCMAKYRPSFISATKSLYENDLIFTERSFQRTLLEYENLISMSPSPTIIWRRTGEIVALTNEFAVMTGYSRMSLLSKRTYIVELMDDESTINYFRSFSEFAFGDLNATYVTDCNLRKAEDDNYLRCCCVWTIKRDVFDIPMLIVGQFLPVLE